MAFPHETSRWLDKWTRPKEILSGDTQVEVVELDTLEINGQKVVGGASGRVFKGSLYFGHIHFEWIMGLFLAIQQIQSQV